jgi:hypothetical protein
MIILSISKKLIFNDNPVSKNDTANSIKAFEGLEIHSRKKSQKGIEGLIERLNCQEYFERAK